MRKKSKNCGDHSEMDLTTAKIRRLESTVATTITSPAPNKMQLCESITYHHQIIDEILQKENLDVNDYNSLAGMAKSNPLIIEGKLPEIFEKILMAERKTEEIVRSYEVFMIEILEACGRLRREKKLVGWVLSALKRSLSSGSMRAADTIAILPNAFIDKFTASIRSMYNVAEVLASFNYHFDVIEEQEITSDTTTIMMAVASRLLVAFLEGVSVFDHSTPLNTRQNFIKGIVKFGDILKKLTNFIFPVHYKKPIASSILSVISCWESVISFAKNYAPDALTEDVSLSFEKNIHTIHGLINEFNLKSTKKYNTDKALLACQLEKAKIDGKSLIIPENIENLWTTLLDDYPYVISNLNCSQISTLARLLRIATQFSADNTVDSTRITLKVVQNNSTLVTALIIDNCIDIMSNLPDSVSLSKELLAVVTKKSWECQKSEKILKSFKKILTDAQWKINDDELSTTIIQNLRIILLLPLIHLNTQLQTVIFLIIFTISKEWSNSKEIVNLCTTIMSDLSETSRIDILQYIKPQYIIEELPKNSALTKHLQCSLCNIENYDLLSKFIKANKSIDDCTALTIIDCIDKVKSKLNVGEKEMAGKIKKQLSMRILNNLQNGLFTSHQVKCLTIAVKDAVCVEKIDDILLENIRLALKNVFERNENSKANSSSLTNEGLELMKIILQHRSIIPINDEIIKQTWLHMMKNPSADIVINLLSAVVPGNSVACNNCKKCKYCMNLQKLKKILDSLHKQTIDALQQNDEILFEKSLSIWCCLSQIDIAGRPNNVRQRYLQTLFEHFVTWRIAGKNCSNILQLCTKIIAAKKTIISDENIDLTLLIADRMTSNLSDMTPEICNELLSFCFGFVKHRPGVIVDRLPLLLPLYCRAIRFIVDKSREKNRSCTAHELQCLALTVNKIAVFIVKFKKDLTRVSPYVIADIISIYSEGVIPSFVKEPLDDTIGVLLSICDQHGTSMLFRVLPPAMQQIFKSSYDIYTKFYKYTGKI